jgi:hypothetical protein
MTVYHLYVRCTRCGARAMLYTITPALLQREPDAPLDPAPAQAWMHQHQAEAHSPDDPTRQEIARWLLGYRPAVPPPPYELVQEAEEL